MPPANDFERLIEARRILVLGSSGSGKTHLTLRLAPLLGLDPIHLDGQFWQQGWVPSPRAQWAARVDELVQRPEWIMDGLYEGSLGVRLPRAQAVILLESTALGCLWRVVKRYFTLDDQNRPDAPAGQKVDAAFIRYIWRYPSVTRPQVLQLLGEQARDKCVIVLKNRRQVQQLLDEVARRVRAQSPAARMEPASP